MKTHPPGKNTYQQDRSRVTYGSEALYVSTCATGYHFAEQIKSDPDGAFRNIPHNECSGNLIRQLARIQSMNYGFKVNRVDANEFGHAARVDTAIITTPDITLDFEYLLADGYNEQLMNFVIDGETSTLTNHVYQEGCIGLNFFILVSEYSVVIR